MIVHPETRSILIRSRRPNFITSTIPKSRLLDYNGHNVAVKHGIEEVQVLRNLDIEVPSPILYYYNWPGRYTPFEHQKATAAFMTCHKRGFVLNDMGTGKTASVLWALDYLMQEGVCGRVVVASPLSTISKVWRDEVFQVLMHRTCSVLHGSRATRFERLARPADFYIVNHDGLQIIMEEIVRRKDIGALVIDEASIYRNSQTTKYKALRALTKARPDLRLFLLTGSPCPNAPTDAWAPARLVNPSKVPDFFGHFRAKVMLPVGPFKWVPRAGAYDMAYAAMQPAIRFRKEDCIDLPPVTFESREVALTDEQKKAFKEMHKHMVLQHLDSLAAGTINAVNAADQVNKLRQILCGVVRVPGTDEYVEIAHQPRVDAVLECIEQARAKVLVIVPFKGIIKSLAADIGKHYSCEILNGDVPTKQRDEIITNFKGAKDPHVLLCHPKVMSHGLNFVEADTTVFYAPISSNDEYQQVIERMNRPGQVNKMTVVRLGAHKIEWQMYDVVDERQKNQDWILRLYEAAVSPEALELDRAGVG